MTELSFLQASPRDDVGGSVEPSEPVVSAYTTELARSAGAPALAGDAVAAKVLRRAGLRLGEGASLLVPEIPPGSTIAGGRAPRGLYLSAAVTKRNKARTVFVNGRTLANLHRHIDIERDEVVTRCLAAGAYRRGEPTLWVQRAGSTGVTLAGGRGSWSYSRIGMRARRELMAVTDDGELADPLWLWLGGDGRLLACSTWQSAFQRANERRASFDARTVWRSNKPSMCTAKECLKI